MNRRKLLVNSKEQVAELWDQNGFIKSYMISTAFKGLGNADNSFCTPAGLLKVAHKIGGGQPIGTVFRSRLATGETWKGQPVEEDLVLTRILWLEGAEEKNLNTLERLIYLHGTNHEDKLGMPASQGCIRFSNKEIIEIYNNLEVGSEVFVI